MYPPGQFSLWNRPSVRTGWLGVSQSTDTARDGDRDPGYAHLAVSDPSADATSTQTWAAIEDTDGWAAQRPGRRAAGHSDHGAYPGAGIEPSASLDIPAGPARDSLGGTTAAARPRRGRSPWDSPSVQEQAGPESGVPGPERAPHAPATPPPGSRRSPKAEGALGSPHGAGPMEGAKQGGRVGAAGRRAAASGGAAAARTPPAAGGRSNRVLAVLLAAPVAIVIVVVAVYVYLRSGSTAPSHVAAPAATPAASPSSAAPTLGPWKHIDSRADDPKPLTLAELFPTRFSVAGVAGTRTAERITTKCTKALIGSALQAAVRKAGCTQVMRATYLSANRKMMATIGVLNLAKASGAVRVGSHAGASEFIRQLPGRRGPTKRIAQGTGLVEAVAKGHYLILTFVEYADLKTPSGKRQRTALDQFSTEMISGTANASLSSRMVTGQPTVTP